MVAVGVNKAADQFVRRQDLKLTTVPRPTVVTPDRDYRPFTGRRPERRPPFETLWTLARRAA
jgi:hypothetical protein